MSSTCAICRKPGGDVVGYATLCPDCYNKWQSAETNARLVVAMDRDLESDERLVTCRKVLEAARAALKSAQERLNQFDSCFGEYRFGDDD